MRINFIDTTSALTTFLDALPDCRGQPPSLYMDFEGDNLSRDGTLSLITILVQPQDQLHLIDVTTLKGDAFTTGSSAGTTLKDILEDSEVAKIIFDIRNDSSALFWLYQVRVQGIEDLQLHELASRSFQKRCVKGLAKCIETDSTLTWKQRQQWQAVKNKGRKLFAPQMGGSFAVFDQRPLSCEIKDYCAQDVVHMPGLRQVYLDKLCDAWWLKIADETGQRVRLSQSAGFNGHGRHRAMGPCGWNNWQPAMHERQKRTLFQSWASRATSVPDSAGTSQTLLLDTDDDACDSPATTLPAPATTSQQPLQDTNDNSPSPQATSVPASAGTSRLLPQNTEDHFRNEIDSPASEDNGTVPSSSPSSPEEDESDESDRFRDGTACDSECGYCDRCAY